MLSEATTPWMSLAPALALLVYFFGGFGVYLIIGAVKGLPADPEMETRRSSRFLGRSVRLFLPWILKPLWGPLLWAGVPANALTTLSVLLAAASGMCIAAGRFALGGWLYVAVGICDFLDGRLARARNESSSAGAALDSVLDRYAEGLVLGGLAWYYRESWVGLVVFAGLLGSVLVSYVRARGEGLGADIRCGTMQRPERMIVLAFALVFSPMLEAFGLGTPGEHPMLVGAIVILAVGSHETALRRLGELLRTLAPEIWGAGAARTLKASIPSSTVATVLDFALVLALVHRADMNPIGATLIGCFTGGLFHALLIRWKPLPDAVPPTVFRHVFVSTTSAALNAGGIASLFLVTSLDYRALWWLVRIVVYAAWNYPLHRGYLFLADEDDE